MYQGHDRASELVLALANFGEHLGVAGGLHPKMCAQRRIVRAQEIPGESHVAQGRRKAHPGHATTNHELDAVQQRLELPPALAPATDDASARWSTAPANGSSAMATKRSRYLLRQSEALAYL